MLEFEGCWIHALQIHCVIKYPTSTIYIMVVRDLLKVFNEICLGHECISYSHLQRIWHICVGSLRYVVFIAISSQNSSHVHYHKHAFIINLEPMRLEVAILWFSYDFLLFTVSIYYKICMLRVLRMLTNRYKNRGCDTRTNHVLQMLRLHHLLERETRERNGT